MTEARENRTLVQVKTQRPGKPQDQAPRDAQGVSLTTMYQEKLPGKLRCCTSGGRPQPLGAGWGGANIYRGVMCRFVALNGDSFLFRAFRGPFRVISMNKRVNKQFS